MKCQILIILQVNSSRIFLFPFFFCVCIFLSPPSLIKQFCVSAKSSVNEGLLKVFLKLLLLLIIIIITIIILLQSTKILDAPKPSESFILCTGALFGCIDNLYNVNSLCLVTINCYKNKYIGFFLFGSEYYILVFSILENIFSYFLPLICHINLS